MAPITTSTEIDRPAAEVFAYATDPTRFSEWQKGVVDGHMDQAGTPQVGAQVHRPPGASAGPTGRRPPRSRTSTHPEPGACTASTDRSGRPSISPSNRSPKPGPG